MVEEEKQGSAAQGSDGTSPAQSWWRFLPLVVLLLILAAVYFSGATRYLRLETLLENRERLQDFVMAHRYEAFFVYMAIYALAVALSLPGAAFLTLIGGFLFGWFAGGTATLVAATVGATVVFLAARGSLGEMLLGRAGPRLQRLAAGFREDAFSYLLFLRLLPLFPFWLVNLAPAFFGVSLRTYVLATLIGILPGTYAFAVAGSGLDSLLYAQRHAHTACMRAGGEECGVDLSLKALMTPQLLTAFVALAFLSLIPVLVKRLYAQRF